MRKLFISAICLLTVATATAQEKKEKSEFKLSGKPIVTVFANYNAGIGTQNKKSGFNLERAYLGYDAKVAKNLSAKVVFDIGTSKVAGSDLERLAYVKNAQITWKLNDFTLDFGLVGLNEFSFQEKFWGYRYIYKSFQDENKFGSSADMGIVGTYKFTKWLSTDLSITNGEGYKKLNIDNRNRYGLGVTATPVKGLSLRAYFDNYSHSEGVDKKDQQTMALFAGYQYECFSVGAEYNKQFNQKFVKDANVDGYSIYASGNIAKNFTLFARYDYIDKSGDKSTIIGGIQYEPLKYLRISPNYQSIQKKDFIFVSVEFKL